MTQLMGGSIHESVSFHLGIGPSVAWQGHALRGQIIQLGPSFSGKNSKPTTFATAWSPGRASAEAVPTPLTALAPLPAPVSPPAVASNT